MPTLRRLVHSVSHRVHSSFNTQGRRTHRKQNSSLKTSPLSVLVMFSPLTLRYLCFCLLLVHTVNMPPMYFVKCSAQLTHHECCTYHRQWSSTPMLTLPPRPSRSTKILAPASTEETHSLGTAGVGRYRIEGESCREMAISAFMSTFVCVHLSEGENDRNYPCML